MSTSIDKYSFFLCQTISSQLHDDLFESDISILIEHQWQQNRRAVICNNLIYFLYSVLMICEMCQTEDGTALGYILICVLAVMSILLLLKEAFHFKFSFSNGKIKEYMKRPKHGLRVMS